MAAHTSLIRIEPAALFRVVPFALFIAVLALRGAVESFEPFADLDGRWLYAVQALLPAFVLVLYWRRYEELRHVPRSGLLWLVAAAAGFLIFVLWIHATLPWMHLSGNLGETSVLFEPLAPDGTLQWPLIAVRLFGAALVVPLIEELFWRSYLMRWIDRREFLLHLPGASSLFAMCASSAVFALAHDLWLAGFAAGLLFAWLYRWSGSLWYPIVAHLVANLALGIWVVVERRWEFW